MTARHWTRSKKGNLWRKVGRLTATVYRRPDRSYGWCLADSDGPQFCNEVFADEESALDAVESEIVRQDLLLEALL